VTGAVIAHKAYLFPNEIQSEESMSMFMRILAEKGYLDDPEPMVAGLYVVEPDFIALVKQRS
jgi:hypothetical protein